MIKIVEDAAERCGGVVALGKSLGINYRSMHSWERVPAGRVLDIERLTGISRSVIRPDIYPPALSESASPAAPSNREVA